MERNAVRIVLVLLALGVLFGVTLMTERSVPESAPPPSPVEPLVRGLSEVIEPLPSQPSPHVRRPGAHHAHRTAAPAPARRVPFQDLLRRAVQRIPSYRDGDAVWRVTTRFGHWGVTDLASSVVYVSPRVPRSRLYDVVAHEWSHVLSVRAYDGDVPRAVDAFNRWFGGHGLIGAERAADCMARLLGARWTHYTSCRDQHWRQGARRLAAAQRL